MRRVWTARAASRGLVRRAVGCFVVFTATVGAYLFVFAVMADMTEFLAIVAANGFTDIFDYRYYVSVDEDLFS